MNIGAIGHYSSIESMLELYKTTPTSVITSSSQKVSETLSGTNLTEIAENLSVLGPVTLQPFEEILSSMLIPDADRAFRTVERSIKANMEYRDFFPKFQNYGSYTSACMTNGYDTVGALFDGLA